MNFTILDLDNWPRKEHFHFFKDFDEPFFSVTVQMDVTKAHTKAKKEKWSFFLYYFHLSLVAANETEPFRYRIHEDEIRVYEAIHGGSTILRPDDTFGFSHIPYKKDFNDFLPGALAEIKRVQEEKGLNPGVSGSDVIHFSAIPWLAFTSITHARNSAFPDSIPKISFGKMTKSESGKLELPLSIRVHHALMDGIHVSRFVNRFQELLDG